MRQDFDLAAQTYDDKFTYSHVGRRQRADVWEYLDGFLPKTSSINILEINCGTGYDALKMAKKGHAVTASDISNEMLKVARGKTDADKVKFVPLDITRIDETFFSEKFDLVFSNFGGLNCIDGDALTTFNKKLELLLKPKGSFIGIIMPTFSLWETFYFGLKFNFKQAFRRGNGPVMANVSGEKVKTWYYSPSDIKKTIPERFQVAKVLPVGLFIPPSFLEPFFAKRLGLFSVLGFLEKHLAKASWQAALSDHYLIHYQKR